MAWCAQPGFNGIICTNFLIPSIESGLFTERSLYYYQHVHQNAIANEFQPLGGVTEDNLNLLPVEDYPINTITSIPLSAISGSADTMCPPAQNLAILLDVPGATLDTFDGFDHWSFMYENGASYVDLLATYLSDVNEPLVNTAFCPAPDCEES